MKKPSRRPSKARTSSSGDFPRKPSRGPAPRGRRSFRDRDEDRFEEDRFERERERELDEPRAPQQKAVKREAVAKAFAGLWSDLFSSPVHLDSALSKQPKNLKSVLAQITPTILLRPASQAEAMGIGVPSGEPWSLQPGQLKSWRPASILAERSYEGMVQRPVAAEPVADDFPPHMVEEWAQEWGEDRAKGLVAALATEAPLSLRVSRRFKVQDVLKGLKDGSRLPVSADPSELSPQGIVLGGYAPVLGTEWYEKGAFEIQDEGSQVMSYFALWPELFKELLSEAPGMPRKAKKRIELPSSVKVKTVVDACAGAGGKSLAMADALQGKARVFAYDVSLKKLQALRRRATHAGFNNIQTVALKEGEEAQSLQKFQASADIVLVDAPCSGWGVLRRNPDIKWRQSTDALRKMPEIQKRLLSLYSGLVAPGGRLVFGTCTFRKAETLEIVREFLKANPGFEARQGGFLGPSSCDGFFMQAFERVGK